MEAKSSASFGHRPDAMGATASGCDHAAKKQRAAKDAVVDTNCAIRVAKSEALDSPLFGEIQTKLVVAVVTVIECNADLLLLLPSFRLFLSRTLSPFTSLPTCKRRFSEPKRWFRH